jgi:hypothetical protein
LRAMPIAFRCRFVHFDHDIPGANSKILRSCLTN